MEFPQEAPHLRHMDNFEQGDMQQTLATGFAKLSPNQQRVLLDSLKFTADSAKFLGVPQIAGVAKLLNLSLRLPKTLKQLVSLPKITDVASSFEQFNLNLESEAKALLVPLKLIKCLDQLGIISCYDKIFASPANALQSISTYATTAVLEDEFNRKEPDTLSVIRRAALIGKALAPSLGLPQLIFPLSIVCFGVGIASVMQQKESAPPASFSSLHLETKKVLHEQFKNINERVAQMDPDVQQYMSADLTNQNYLFDQYIETADNEFRLQNVIRAYTEEFLPAIGTDEQIDEATALLNFANLQLEKTQASLNASRRMLADFQDLLESSIHRIEHWHRDEPNSSDQRIAVADHLLPNLKQIHQEAATLFNKLWRSSQSLQDADPLETLSIAERSKYLQELHRLCEPAYIRLLTDNVKYIVGS